MVGNPRTSSQKLPKIPLMRSDPALNTLHIEGILQVLDEMYVDDMICAGNAVLNIIAQKTSRKFKMGKKEYAQFTFIFFHVRCFHAKYLTLEME